MASIFEPVTLGWQGVDYVIPADRIMRAIAVIEDVVTIAEIADMAAGRVKLVKLSRAYAAVLRVAGAKVGDDEVYAGMFGGGSGGAEQQVSAVAAVASLLQMMIPPDAAKSLAAAEKPPPGKVEPTRSASSEAPTG